MDGETHATEKEIAYDKQRQREIEMMGIRFLRFSNMDVFRRRGDVVQSITEKVSELEKSGETEKQTR